MPSGKVIFNKKGRWDWLDAKDITAAKEELSK